MVVVYNLNDISLTLLCGLTAWAKPQTLHSHTIRGGIDPNLDYAVNDVKTNCICRDQLHVLTVLVALYFQDTFDKTMAFIIQA